MVADAQRHLQQRGALPRVPRCLSLTGQFAALAKVRPTRRTCGRRPRGTLHCGNLSQHNPDGTTGPCHEYTGLTSGLLPCPGCQAGYHVYTVIIDRRNPAAQQIRWYLDGHLFYPVREAQVGAQAWTQAVDHGFSIILDLAIGGKYPDNNCHCTTPDNQTASGAAMTVRYVRVYRALPS